MVARQRSIRFWLGCLVVACILPASLVAVGLTLRAYDRELADIERDTVATARALVQAVDGELTGAISALQALATSPLLAAGDLAGFYRQAELLLETRSGSNIVLTLPSGQQVLNTLRPLGAALPSDGNPGTLAQVFETGRPAIDFIEGPVAGRPLVAVEVPVRLDGKVAYGLGMGIAQEDIGRILARQDLPGDRVVSIFDDTGTTVARNRRAAEFIGKKGAPQLVERIAQAKEGAVETRSLEGIAMVWNFSRSPVSGWSVAIGVPRAGLLAELWQSLLFSAMAAAGLLLIALAMARTISLRIIGSIQALAAPALSLSAPGRLSVPRVEITEVDELGQALAKASQLIEQRAAERDAAADALRELQSELLHVSRLSSMGQMATTLAHEMNQPLAAVANYLSAGRRLLEVGRAEDRDKILQHMGKAGEQIERAGQIIRRIRSFIAGGEALRRPEDLNQTVEEAVALALVGAKQHGVLFKAELSHSLPQVMIDRVQIQQVLFNLLRNAIEAMDVASRRELTLATSRLSPTLAQVVISDTGPGIAPEVLCKLFEPFVSTKAAGMGLGLSICRSIIDSHGGSLTAESDAGNGATFRFTVPIASAEEFAA
jgi:signal transduction histidine kinase